MSITTVRVLLTQDAHWAVDSDDPNGRRINYPSRGAAIAAGVHMAMTEDAVLLIHGIDDMSELDFRDVAAAI